VEEHLQWISVSAGVNFYYLYLQWQFQRKWHHIRPQSPTLLQSQPIAKSTFTHLLLKNEVPFKGG